MPAPDAATKAWLIQQPFVKSLAAADQSWLAERCQGGSWARGEFLFTDQDRFTTLWWVRDGEVKITRSSAAGREQILYIAREGRLLIEVPLGADEDSPYFVNAIALHDCTAVGVPAAALRELLNRAPDARSVLLRLVSRRLKRMVDLAEDLALKAVHNRLASFLFTNAIREGATSDAPFTLERDLALETVAGRIGTVREEVSRALNEFKKQGLIDFTRKEITILDLPALEEAIYRGR